MEFNYYPIIGNRFLNILEDVSKLSNCYYVDFTTIDDVSKETTFYYYPYDVLSRIIATILNMDNNIFSKIEKWSYYNTSPAMKKIVKSLDNQIEGMLRSFSKSELIDFFYLWKEHDSSLYEEILSQCFKRRFKYLLKKIKIGDECRNYSISTFNNCIDTQSLWHISSYRLAKNYYKNAIENAGSDRFFFGYDKRQAFEHVNEMMRLSFLFANLIVMFNLVVPFVNNPFVSKRSYDIM